MAKDANMRSFKSEYWMVASGIVGKLDMIVPKMLDKEAFGHSYAGTEKTPRLTTN